MAIDLSKELSDILDEYALETNQIVEESAEIATKETIKNLKASSPKGDRGKYQKGWSFVKEKKRAGIKFIIKNKEYRLTHLLNNGHAVVNQHGRYSGRVKDDNHIKKAEEFSKNKFLEEIEKRL